MAKIRVLFGHQIRLNYGDPQPMALHGRLVAVAEIALELLSHGVCIICGNSHTLFEIAQIAMP